MIPTISVGSIYVGGNLYGPAYFATVHAGQLLVFASKIGTVTVKGSVIGGTISDTGSGTGSGELDLGENVLTKSLTIGGDIIGGSGVDSGGAEFVASAFTLGGSVIGGTNFGAGIVEGAALTATIKGSVIGGTTDGTNDLAAGGLDFVLGLGTLNVHGNLIAGKVTGGTENVNGSIIDDQNATAIHIGGSIIGTDVDRALVLVQGEAFMAPGIHNAIGSVTVGGSVEYGVIASGHTQMNVGASLGNATNPNASIGKVTINGDFYHSSIMAGTNDNDLIGAGRLNPMNVNPDTQSVGTGSLATLGPVVIKGALLDDLDSNGDSGFEAAQITSITAGGALLYTHGSGLKFFDPNHFVFAQEITPT
jgi:hypothetical protein